MPRGRPPKNSPPRVSDLLELLELWKRAAMASLGITIPCENPNRLAQKLYAARRETGGFNELKVVEGIKEVKIVKRTV